LPPEALTELAAHILRFVPAEVSPGELRKVIINYFYDGPQVEAMARPGLPEGERYWEAIRAWFVRLAVGYGVESAEAEDVAQDAWSRARQSLHTFVFRGRLRAWLRAIIVHACQQWYRQQKPEALSLDDPNWKGESISAGNEGPERALLQAERRLLLEATFERLLSHRNLLILRYSFPIGDNSGAGQPLKWTDTRIARQVGLAPGSISATRDRILRRLATNPELVRLVEELYGPDWLKGRSKRRRKVSE
jgi:RNA polymerase sigma factor (sigma-70 family)